MEFPAESKAADMSYSLIKSSNRFLTNFVTIEMILHLEELQ